VCRVTNEKIRLVQITHDLEIGGLQRVVVNICRTIDRDRFDVRVLCLRSLGPFTADVERLGIPVQLIPQTGRTDYLSFLKVAQALGRERAQVIHTHNTQPFVDGTIGALMARVRTIVHTDHARDFPDKLRYMIAERIMSSFAYRVVGVSEHTSANLAAFEHIPPRKIETIPNGVDGSVFDVATDRAEARAEFGIPRGAKAIGLAVRLTEQKGITFLLNALPAVARAFPDVVLVVAGEGPAEAALKSEAEALGVAGRVRFVGPRRDVPVLLKALDAYVLPSVWEGLPMVLLEAMAAGCPIVATSVGGVPSALEDGRNGLLVPPRDPAELATAITRMLGDDALSRRCQASGKEIFARRFSARAMTRRYEQLYLRQDAQPG
jgi:glycosyltransferase involved in cell wall biosynthesis